ncbi:MAG: hypothetical protein OEV74_21775 [Cyclobacteriaceae bacterium]|nr:hypothetical protein [Cyclobacteriaceae bacterium]MDH4298914.1 hypothetical protein [Cyclobacteriaceae bacterium]MDH5251572.1 hypothetical protein [Cyclobacteriaceae bacterium]
MRLFAVGVRILIFVAISTELSFGQPQAGGPQTPDAVPITGIEYLLIGGGAYGISRLLKNRNKKDNPS